jgi:hypothetical protein
MISPKSKRHNLWPERYGSLRWDNFNFDTTCTRRCYRINVDLPAPKSCSDGRAISLNIKTPVVHAGAGDALLIDDTSLDLSCNNDRQPFFFLVSLLDVETDIRILL